MQDIMYDDRRNRCYYHQAFTYLVLLHTCNMKDDRTGLYKGRLQMKSIPYEMMPGGRRSENVRRHTYYIRGTNGHTFPGILCPESLFQEVTSFGNPRDPERFVHGTTWNCVNSVLRKGLSCRGEDSPDPHKRGRQFVHGCPYLPGDKRILSGIRPDSDCIIFVSLKSLLQQGHRVWRSANDIILTSGFCGRIHPRCIMQITGLRGEG